MVWFLLSCSYYGFFVENCPHRQAINDAARPFRLVEVNAIPKPCERDGGGFAEISWNVDELRMADCGWIVPRQTGLVIIGALPVAM